LSNVVTTNLSSPVVVDRRALCKAALSVTLCFSRSMLQAVSESKYASSHVHIKPAAYSKFNFSKSSMMSADDLVVASVLSSIIESDRWRFSPEKVTLLVALPDGDAKLSILSIATAYHVDRPASKTIGARSM